METAAPAAAARAALAELDVNPPTQEERRKACRSLVRYAKLGNSHAQDQIQASEEWVRLYVALRRVCGESARVSESELREWKASVSAATTIKRKCFIVERARLDRLPEWPAGLEDWVIPHGELDLPADIYTNDTVIIDDGCDRAKLQVPVLHLELSVKWQRKQSASASGVSTQLAAPAARAQRLEPSHASPSAGSAGPGPAGGAPARVPACMAAPTAGDQPMEAMEGLDMYHIVQSTVKAVTQ